MLDNFRSILHQKINSQQPITNPSKFNLQKSKSIDNLNSNRNNFEDPFRISQFKDTKEDTVSYRSTLTKFNEQKSKELIESIREMRQQVHKLINLQQQKQGINKNDDPIKITRQQLNDSNTNLNDEQQNQKKIIELEEKIQNLQQLIEDQRQQINNLRNILIDNENNQQEKQEQNIQNLMDIKSQYTEIIETLKSEIDRKNQQIHELYNQNKAKYNQINSLKSQFFQINEQDKKKQQDNNEENQIQQSNQHQYLNERSIIQQQVDQQMKENCSDQSENGIQYQLNAKKSEVFALEQQINGLLRAIEDIRAQLQKSESNLNNKIRQMNDLKNENQHLEYTLIQLQQDASKRNKIIQQISEQLGFYKNTFNIFKESDQFSNFLKSIQQKIPDSTYLLLQNAKIIQFNEELLTLTTNLKSIFEYRTLDQEKKKQQIDIIDDMINQINGLTQQIVQRDSYIKNQIEKQKIIHENSVNKFFTNSSLQLEYQISITKQQYEQGKIEQLQKQNSQLRFQLNKLKLDKSINSEA